MANQLQLSLTHAPIVAQGLAANMVGLDQSVTLDGGGILDYCRVHRITVQAWSPFQAGFFTGTFLGSSIRDHYEEWPLPRLLGAWREAGIGDVHAQTLSLGGGVVTWGRKK